ncbi:MAG: DUF2892 domain-containing protein [Bacteroidota bacterium]
MKKNLGSTDKVIRLILAVVLLVLFFTNTVSGVLGIVALVAAAISAGTALINFCPLYAALGIRSNK